MAPCLSMTPESLVAYVSFFIIIVSSFLFLRAGACQQVSEHTWVHACNPKHIDQCMRACVRPRLCLRAHSNAHARRIATIPVGVLESPARLLRRHKVTPILPNRESISNRFTTCDSFAISLGLSAYRYQMHAIKCLPAV